MKNKNKNISKILISALAFVVLLPSVALASEITTENLYSLVNRERVYRGIPGLRVSDKLQNAAIKKSSDMLKRNYFEHYFAGLTPWDFIVAEGYDYLYAGENLAMDFDTAEGMVRAWMNSPNHRKNILNPDFDEMGMGVVKGVYADDAGDRETIMVTNMFGREKPPILKFIDRFIERVRSLF